MDMSAPRRSRHTPQSQFGVRELVEIVFRRKFLFVLPCILCFVASVFLAATLPKVYEAKTLVFIESPVARNPLERAVDPEERIVDRIRTIQEHIYSFSFLSEVISSISEINLRINNEAEKESYVERMRNNLTINVRGIDLFEIQYRDPSPRLAQTVANVVTNKYIEESLTQFGSQYEQALSTFEKQREDLLEELKSKEEQMTYFRELNKDFLVPEVSVKQQIYRQQEDLRRLSNELRAATRQMEILQTNLENTPETVETEKQVERDPKVELIRSRLRQLELERDQLLLRWTENHPQVKAITDQVTMLQAQLEETESDKNITVTTSINPIYQSLVEQINQQSIEIEKIRGMIESGRQNLSQLKLKEEKVPSIEEEHRNLTRDYDILKENYDQVLRQIQSLRNQQKLEQAGQAIEFKIRDTARLPTTPVSPNVFLISAGGLAAGLALGFGLVFMMEFVDHSLRTVEQARAFLNIPVLGTIPVIVTEEEMRRAMNRRRLIITLYSIFGVLAAVGVGIFAYLNWQEIAIRLGL